MHSVTQKGLGLSLLVATILGLTIFGVGLLEPHGVSAERPGSNLATCGATDVQFLGQSEALNDATVGGVPIVELSGITYDPRSDLYYANWDRVSGSAQSRFFTLDIPLSAEALGTPSALSSTVLRKADGSPSTGSDFDAEGIALTHQGELLIASEGRAAGANALFQTEVRQYSLDGTLLATLPVPNRFLIPPAPGGQGVGNLVFESMALSPNGRSLFTANETPLTADGVTSEREGRIRILQYEDRGPGGFVPVAEYFYLMEPARNSTGALEVGVAEIIALSETELLVLERGFVGGVGNTVRIFRVSLKGAQAYPGRAWPPAS